VGEVLRRGVVCALCIPFSKPKAALFEPLQLYSLNTRSGCEMIAHAVNAVNAVNAPSQAPGPRACVL
jgi:hypothetical protein